GIQADIKAVQANGVFAATVLTAITAQNTKEVTAAKELSVKMIKAQFEAVWLDIAVHAVKTGMLSSVPVIEAVAGLLERHVKDVPIVVDPVMISKSGFSLLQDDAIEVLKDRIVPLATLLTPNAHEASRLSGLTVRDVESAREAAGRIYDLGCGAVLVKGGHLEREDQAVDVLFDGESVHTFSVPRIDTPNTHGTGCTYASAVAANLAKGYSLVKSVERAKRYVTAAIEHALRIGSGHGPTGHFFYLHGIGRFPIEDV
ncbi:MAG: bifunctional hydroxymethylpyrimidine kinase/phosphomethylpyrimidine kinase, partial [Rhodothermales bacterium]|nr:bifunctional hydroxymethylpyrimidine kinase/phosphomethylpyrimidine kinase [Rhodothermales bacterium]